MRLHARSRRSTPKDDTTSLPFRRENVRMKDRMLSGELYLADDPELIAEHARAQELLERYNATRDAERDERARLLRDLLRSEEHTSELQSRPHLVCRLLL